MAITFELATEAELKRLKRDRWYTHEVLKPVAATQAVHDLGGFKIEAAGANLPLFNDGEVHPGQWEINPFLNAIHMAFDRHWPLLLSPDDVWIAVAQGFAQHVSQHAEELRKHFVAHEGKLSLEVIRNDFVKGSPDNNWPGVFGEFSDQIGQHIGKKRDLLVSEFSTTGPIEKAASEVVLLDAMQAYFTYDVRTMCGIPFITLAGEVADWKRVRVKAQNLAEFGCADWIKSLDVVLGQFEAAAEGKVDKSFWCHLCKFSGGSGGPDVTGAVNAFFPYLKHGRPNPLATAWAKDGRDGPHPTDYPTGLASAPFVWDYLGQEFDMRFLGGFVGLSQTPETNEVRPALGWAVMDQLKCGLCQADHHEAMHPCKHCGREQQRHEYYTNKKCGWQDDAPTFEPA